MRKCMTTNDKEIVHASVRENIQPTFIRSKRIIFRYQMKDLLYIIYTCINIFQNSAVCLAWKHHFHKENISYFSTFRRHEWHAMKNAGRVAILNQYVFGLDKKVARDKLTSLFKFNLKQVYQCLLNSTLYSKPWMSWYK
jgi:hypothetical protein